jgi:GAF domain-containing protein
MRNDPDRLAALRRAMILDSSPEKAFDDITRLLATALDVPIALVNMLDEDRDWFKSRVGIGLTQSAAATSLCDVFFAEQADLIVVPDTQLDARFNANPLVTGQPFVRFYAAARLMVDGATIGTLCAYDIKPKALGAEQLDQLRTMAATAMSMLRQRAAALPTTPTTTPTP